MMLWIILISTGLYHGVNTECMDRGRLPNDITGDCRGYSTCIPMTDKSFYHYNLVCPPNSIFNHFDSQCTNTTGYYCHSSYNCTKLGNFPHSGSTDCTSYITCIQGLDALTARLVDCPVNTVYSPKDALCVEDTVYTCPSATLAPDIFVNISNTDLYWSNVSGPTPEPSISSTAASVSSASITEYFSVLYLFFFSFISLV